MLLLLQALALPPHALPLPRPLPLLRPHTIVAVAHIGIILALVGTLSHPVSRFATSVAVSGLGAGWLSAHLGLKQGIDLNAGVCPVGRSDGLEGGRRSS